MKFLMALATLTFFAVNSISAEESRPQENPLPTGGNSLSEESGTPSLAAASLSLQNDSPASAGEAALDGAPLPDPPPVLPLERTSARESSSLFPDLHAAKDTRSIHTGGFGLVLHGNVRASFESNIFIQPDHEEEDFIFTLAPGIALGWGEYKSEILEQVSFRERYDPEFPNYLLDKSFIYLDYVPSFTFFTDHSEEDSFDQDATLRGQWVGDKLTLGVQARFQTLNAPDVDVGDRVEQRRLTIGLTSNYAITGKSSLEINAYHFLRDYERDNDTREWRNQNWWNYFLTSRLRLSAGLTAGYVESSEGPHQTYEQGLLRLRYIRTEKLTLNATAGLEFRQVSGDDDQLNPIIAVGATWEPYEGTYLAINAFSRTLTSASQGQTYTNSGIDLSVRQRFLQRCYVGLAAGYQHSDYDARRNLPGSSREDDIYFIRPSVAWDITRSLSLEAGVEWRRNDSSNSARSFDNLTAYIQLNAIF